MELEKEYECARTRQHGSGHTPRWCRDRLLRAVVPEKPSWHQPTSRGPLRGYSFEAFSHSAAPNTIPPQSTYCLGPAPRIDEPTVPAEPDRQRDK
eukprot:scaffold87715_cov32-Tisochrysis_lutea.AAC.3